MRKHYMTVGLVILAACSGKTSIPNNILSPEEMIPVLVQIHQADAKVANLRISEDSSYTVMRHMELYVYEQMGVTEEKYRASQQWYLEHPEVYSEVYTKVVDSLSYLEQTITNPPQVNEEEEEANRANDVHPELPEAIGSPVVEENDDNN